MYCCYLNKCEAVVSKCKICNPDNVLKIKTNFSGAKISLI